MKKTTKLILGIVMTLSANAYGQHAPTQDVIANCTITEVRPEGANFFWLRNIAPKIGDKTSINLSQTEITSIVFQREGHNGLPPSIPLAQAGAKLTLVDTPDQPGLRRFEGRHVGEMTRTEYQGLLLAFTTETEAYVVIDVLAVDFNGMELNKAIMNCTIAS